MRKVGTLACLISSVMSINAQIIEAGESNPIWGVRAAFDVNLPGKVHGNGYSIYLTDRISIAPFTGPEMSYSFAGAIKVHDKEKLGIDDTSLFGKFGNQRRFECGWKIGIAFFTGLWSFNIDGTIGMTNLMTNGTRFHENRGSVNVTRYF